MSRTLILLLAITLWTQPAPGRAEDVTTPSVAAERQARELFQTGLTHSSQERWTDAARAFEASAQVVARPSTLQNLVAALRRAGQNEAAIRAIDRYLALATADEYAATRHQLEETRVTLQRELAAERAQPAPMPAPASNEIERPKAPATVAVPRASVKRPTAPLGNTRPASLHSRRTLAWVSLGASSALATTASALLISSELDTQRFRDRCAIQACSEERLAGPQRSIDRRDRASYALFGLAAASAIVGTTLLWLDLRAERPLKLGIAPTHAILRLRF